MMPTITDCNLAMGLLSANNFLGGGMRLDTGAAGRTIEEKIARPLGMDVVSAAEGIVRIIDVKMEEAIKAISTMRGHDLRDFHLLAFGGAGPVHAGRIARDLGMAGIIVPLYPGVYSAIGLLMSDVKHDYVRSRMTQLHRLDPADVNAMFDTLVAQAREELREDGFGEERISVQRALDMRYAGQGYEMTLPVGEGPLGEADLVTLRQAFDAQHKAMFGHSAPEQPVEIVSYRVRGIGLVPAVEMPRFVPTGATLDSALRERRRVRFDGAEVDCPVYQREKIDVGATVEGPAILDQFDCTTVLCPGQVARVDDYKNLIVGMGR
jgi:N-methylhydantoinase A